MQAGDPMNTVVTFTADRFRPVLSEEAQVNPGRYGAELAWWLCTELAKRGVETGYPEYEDWGWFIEYAAGGGEYWLCCGNLEGTDNRWHLFLDAKAKGLFARNRAPVEAARPLLEALRGLLQESEAITEVEWSEYPDAG